MALYLQIKMEIRKSINIDLWWFNCKSQSTEKGIDIVGSVDISENLNITGS